MYPSTLLESKHLIKDNTSFKEVMYKSFCIIVSLHTYNASSDIFLLYWYILIYSDVILLSCHFLPLLFLILLLFQLFLRVEVREEERENKTSIWERLMDWLPPAHKGTNLQPRYICPWSGIKPSTFLCLDQHSTAEPHQPESFSLMCFKMPFSLNLV